MGEKDVEKGLATPQAQVMDAIPTVLSTSDGIVIRQTTDVGEVIAQALLPIPCMKKNKYFIAPMPDGKRTLHSKGDKGGWKPSGVELDGIPKTLLGKEESSCPTNILLYILGCMNLRPLTMPFKQAGVENFKAAPADFYLSRPFNLGACLCCPHTTYLEFPTANGKVAVGKVQEDMQCGKNYIWRYLQRAYCCKFYYDLMVVEEGGNAAAPKFTPRYQLEVSTCLCGPHNNVCGATCFNNDMLWNVYEYESGSKTKTIKGPAGYVQKTYASSCAGLLRCCCDFSNYLIEFPKDANEVEKGLFMAAFLNTEYVHFEKGGDN